DLATSFGVTAREGVLVTDVMKAGPAETAGLRAGDVITELADGKITEVPDLQKRVAAHAPGESLTLTVVRDRKPVAVRITLGEMPSDETLVAATGAAASWGMNVEAIGPAMAGRVGIARALGGPAAVPG